MTKWEYKTLKFGAKGFFGGKVDVEELGVELNQLGERGWELISVFDANAVDGVSRDIVAVLKRSA
jgi:hypothetical protein